MDRAYGKLERLDRYKQEGQSFVIRLRDNVYLEKPHALQRLVAEGSSVIRDITCQLGTPQCRSEKRHRVVIFRDFEGVQENFPYLKGVRRLADEINKDVVGARLNIDTSKLLPAFKVIDEGIKKNAEAFRSLNQELTITAKNYSEIARAADKVTLSADERRQKILAESNALVAQRTAQAELLTARKNALDTTNQVIDAKLQAQQAIVKSGRMRSSIRKKSINSAWRLSNKRQLQLVVKKM
jgi:hypothetical protein